MLHLGVDSLRLNAPSSLACWPCKLRQQSGCHRRFGAFMLSFSLSTGPFSSYSRSTHTLDRVFRTVASICAKNQPGCSVNDWLTELANRTTPVEIHPKSSFDFPIDELLRSTFSRADLVPALIRDSDKVRIEWRDFEWHSVVKCRQHHRPSLRHLYLIAPRIQADSPAQRQSRDLIEFVFI